LAAASLRAINIDDSRCLARRGLPMRISNNHAQIGMILLGKLATGEGIEV
jgi:hypothetical protein